MNDYKKNAVEEKNPENAGLNGEWLTRRQASGYLQVGISTLDSCLPIKKYKIGSKSVRYLRKDLDDYLLANCVEPNCRGKRDE
jgi:hypothetical protein